MTTITGLPVSTHFINGLLFWIGELTACNHVENERSAEDQPSNEVNITINMMINYSMSGIES